MDEVCGPSWSSRAASVAGRQVLGVRRGDSPFRAPPGPRSRRATLLLNPLFRLGEPQGLPTNVTVALVELNRIC